MVFLIQRSQNKDSMVIQVKLDELIAAIRGASNRVLTVEELPENEVRRLYDRYNEIARRDQNGQGKYSIEDTMKSH